MSNCSQIPQRWSIKAYPDEQIAAIGHAVDRMIDNHTFKLVSEFSPWNDVVQSPSDGQTSCRWWGRCGRIRRSSLVPSPSSLGSCRTIHGRSSTLLSIECVNFPHLHNWWNVLQMTSRAQVSIGKFKENEYHELLRYANIMYFFRRDWIAETTSVSCRLFLAKRTFLWEMNQLR